MQQFATPPALRNEIIGLLVEGGLNDDGYTEIAEFLISSGADLDLPNRWGWTDLIRAARYGQFEIVEILISAGADLDLKNNSDMSALANADYRGYPEIVELLLANGADESGLIYVRPPEG